MKLNSYQQFFKRMVSKKQLQNAIEMWTVLGNNEWDGIKPYDGLCEYFYQHCNIDGEDTYKMLKKSYGLEYGYFQPLKGKQGAHQRVAVLMQIQEDLYGS